jgi:REP element-mobilizing transposase RayT
VKRLHVQRKRLLGLDYSDPDHVFFVTVAVPASLRDDRQGPFTDQELARRIVDSLLRIREKRGLRLFSYCLMPDHLHLLLSVTGSGVSLSDVMRDFKSYTTRAAWAFGLPRLWLRGYHERVVRDEKAFVRIVNYIRDNPVRSGLVGRADDYSYSGTPDSPP